MATLSSLTDDRLQSVIGNVPFTTGIESGAFAIERGKRLLVDVPFAVVGATALWVGVINPSLWGAAQIPLIWIGVLLVYLLGGDWV